MDYAFVPGIGDKALDVLRAVLALRSNTSVMVDPSVVTVEGFLTGLDVLIDFGAIPVAGDLIAGSHGTAEGQLLLSLDSKTASPAVYESLVKVNTSQTIRIPQGVGTATTSFRLAGCLIGSDECLPFLTMLKQALGNPKSVSAPRYIHAFNTAPDGSSAFEFMKYAYRIVAKDPLTTRDAVVGKFGNAGLKQDLDGTSVPDENWEKWVPAASVLNLAPAISQELYFDFPVKISPAAGGMKATYKDIGTWYSTVDQFTFKVEIEGGIPADEAGRIAAVPLALAQEDTFKATHPYPVYKRYHFNSMQEFVDGVRWKPTLLPNNTLQFVGRRYRYELHVPVLKPGTTDELIYNYYPVTGTPTINFSESNQPYKLFGVV